MLADKSVTLDKMADGPLGHGLRYNPDTGVIETVEWPTGGGSGSLTDTTLYAGTWSATGTYAIARIVEYNGRFYLASIRNGPSSTTPDVATQWHQIDSNMHLIGPWVANSGLYVRGDVVSNAGRLWLLTAANKINSSTAPPGDSDWTAITYVQATATALGLVQKATRAEAEEGTDNIKYMTPLRVRAVSIFKGPWIATGEDYAIGEIVSNAVALWISLTDHTSAGIGPAGDNTNWDRLGSNVDFRGAYASGTLYSYGQIVTHDSRLWILNVGFIGASHPTADAPGGTANKWLALTAAIATRTEAEEGTNADKMMTPERTAQAITAQAAGGTPAYNQTGFPEFARAAGDEYDAEDRNAVETAVWNSFTGEEVIGGIDVTSAELSDARSSRRLRMTSGSAVQLTAARIQTAMDSVDDDQFPAKILLQRGTAGNFNVTRGARVRQGGENSGTKSYAFTADQTRELLITRLSGSGNTSVYNVDVIDGISAGTMIEKVRLATTGFRTIAYLFDRYFNTFRGEWSPDGIYKKSDTVSNNSRLFVALLGTGPSDVQPQDSTAWRPIDNNMSYRGDYVNAEAHYRLGDTVRDGGRLYMLIVTSLVSTTTLPSADPTNWFAVSVPEATEQEVTDGTATGKFISPLALQTKLDALPAPGGSTILDMDGYNILRLETDDQTIAAESTTRQINKGNTENKEVMLSGSPGADVRLVVSTQGESAAHWGGVNFVVSNGTDRPINAYGIATAQGSGATITGTDIVAIPSLRRAIVRISESSAATLSANGLTLAVSLIDGAAGSGTVEFATQEQAQALTATDKALAPVNLAQVLAAWARAAGVEGAGKMPLMQIENAFEFADNANVITKVTGFNLMGAFFTTRTDIGHGNQSWRFGVLDNIFELESVQIGADDNPDRQHNYGLIFKQHVIREEHIRDPLDLNNLLGITFPRYPDTISNNVALIPRLAVPWIGEAGNNLDAFTKSPDEVKITIPNKRTDHTRTITHLLIRAGRVSGIDDTTSRTDIINMTRSDSAVYSETLIPLTVVIGHASGTSYTDNDEYTNYTIAFANGSQASCTIQVLNDISTGIGSVTARAHHGTSGTGFTGSEFMWIAVIRGMGG